MIKELCIIDKEPLIFFNLIAVEVGDFFFCIYWLLRFILYLLIFMVCAFRVFRYILNSGLIHILLLNLFVVQGQISYSDHLIVYL